MKTTKACNILKKVPPTKLTRHSFSEKVNEEKYDIKTWTEVVKGQLSKKTETNSSYKNNIDKGGKRNSYIP